MHIRTVYELGAFKNKTWYKALGHQLQDGL